MAKVNILEKRVKELIVDMGGIVLRGGYPDFMCEINIDGETVRYGIEVKSDADELSQDQIKMHDYFKSIGFPVLVIRPESKTDTEIMRQLLPSLGAKHSEDLVQKLSASREKMFEGIQKIGAIVNDSMNGFTVKDSWVGKAISKWGEEAIIKAVADAKEKFGNAPMDQAKAEEYLDLVSAFAAVNYRSARDPLAREVYLLRGILRAHTDGPINERIARNLIHKLLELNVDTEWLKDKFSCGFRSWRSAEYQLMGWIESLEIETKGMKHASR